MVISSNLHSRSMWCSNPWGLLCQRVDTTFFHHLQISPCYLNGLLPVFRIQYENWQKAAPIVWMALLVCLYYLCPPWGCIEFDYSCVLGLIECVLCPIVSYESYIVILICCLANTLRMLYKRQVVWASLVSPVWTIIYGNYLFILPSFSIP